jgi:hypothetical protein
VTSSLGKALPATVHELLDGRNLSARVGFTILLLTTSGEGWPQVAMLSVGEVLAADNRRLRLALWPGSGSASNLTRSGQATLMLVVGADTYYVRVGCRRLPDLALSHGPRACFDAEVRDVLVDVVPYATVTSGIDFRLNEPEEVLPAWREALTAMGALRS